LRYVKRVAAIDETMWVPVGAGKATDRAAVGGKATGLELLASMGLPVPASFCLTAVALQTYLDANGLAARLATAFTSRDEHTARRELDSIAYAAPLPASVTDALDAGLAYLLSRSPDADALSVRSSAAPEDGAERSFAGVYDTVLGVPLDGLDAAVRRCWSSLWSARALGYDRSAARAGTMAVVVQELVPAEVSAVVFTVNPLTGSDDELLVNATWGLGEPLVSGAVTPDTAVVDRRTLAPLRVAVGNKHERVDARRGGGLLRTTGEGAGTRSLSDDALMQLCRHALRVERALGGAVDVEAALRDGRWTLLQARPATTGRAQLAQHALLG
jgi:phosphoenolpyruvate synthase/pyruvate phosphate dikinase